MGQTVLVMDMMFYFFCQESHRKIDDRDLKVAWKRAMFEKCIVRYVCFVLSVICGSFLFFRTQAFFVSIASFYLCIYSNNNYSCKLDLKIGLVNSECFFSTIYNWVNLL